MVSKLRKLVFILCCMLFSSAAGVEISLSGTVIDEQDAAVSGVAIALVSDTNMKTVTNASGEFTITSTALSRGSTFTSTVQNISSVSVSGKQIRFSIISKVNAGFISIFSCNGKSRAVIALGKMESGVHTYMLPEAAPGFYVLHITTDKYTKSMKLLNAGNQFILSDNVSETTNTLRIYGSSAVESVDTLIVKKSGFKTMKKAISSYKQTAIAILLEQKPVYAYAAGVENTCTGCIVPALPDAAKLSKISKFPDPFMKLDGKRMTKKSEWPCRRQEILRQAEKYIYGEKPAKPEIVSGSVTNTKVSVHVEDLGKKIDFSAVIVLPSKGQAPFPAIINVGAKGGFGGLVLGESRVLEQGVAVIYYNNYDLGVEGTAEQSRGKANPGKFYDIYGGNHSAGLLMAWAWGVSRMIDVLQESGASIIDVSRLGVTGCSRSGKGAFAIGLFDERIALTIPHETSTAGVPAYRIVDVLGKETTKNNYYGLNWLSNNFAPFVLNTSQLPVDVHELIATFAPRGLLILENPSATQMGAPAGNMSAVGGAEVYKALGAEKNLSYNSNTPNGTGHCTYVNEYTDPLIKNITKFLKHETAETGKITAGSGGTVTRSSWIDWTAPVLENDTNLYVTD